MTDTRRRLAVGHPTGPQLRAARALAGVTAAEIAGNAGISLNTVKRAEAAEGLSPITAANAAALMGALERLDIVFIYTDAAGGEGVRRRV